MTVPILMAAAAPADINPAQALPQADGDDGGFGATLGAAMAAQLAGQLTPIVPDPVPTQPLLQLLTDGDWRPDDGQLPSTDEPAAEPGADTQAGTGHDLAIVPLEKSLANWFAAVGRRGETTERAVVPPSGDPAEVDLDAASADPAAADAPGGSPEASGQTVLVSVAAVPVAAPPNLPAPGNSTPGTDQSAPADDETARPDSAPADRASGRAAAGAPDVPRPTEPRGRSFDHYDSPLTQQPAIEIAGFTFHDPAEERGHGTGESPGHPKSAEPAAEWVARVRDYKVTGGDGPAREAGRRASPLAARPVEEPAKSARSGEGAVKAIPQARLAVSAERDNGRSRREVQSAAPAEPPTQRVERPSADGGPRTAPVTTAAGRPLVDTTSTAGPESTAPTVTDPAERIARRVDHLMLDLKDDQGDYGKLRVSVSGSTVRATIMPTDQAMADRLNVEIRQLHQSLTERGFPEPKVTVQNPASIESPRWNPFVRDGLAETAAADHQSPARHGPNDERRERWHGTKEQQQERREQGRTPDQPRQQKRDSNGRDA